MSKTTDRARNHAAHVRREKAIKKWTAKIRLAREYFWQFEALDFSRKKQPNGSRFKDGSERAKHLRGYWQRIEDIAKKRFHGRKPRNFPGEGLSTGELKTGHLTDIGHVGAIN